MNKKSVNELIARQNEIETQMGGFQGRELNAEEQATFATLEREWNDNSRMITLLNQQREAAKYAPVKSKNTLLRETVAAVRSHQLNGDFVLAREGEATPTSAITSGIIKTGEHTNMESAGIPVTINELIKPLESELIYDKIGIRVATGVRGKLQWPVLDNAVEASIGGELEEVETKALQFDKITTTPFKVGMSIEVSNEAINDAAFDLNALVVEQLGRGVGRLLNNRVLALTAPATAAAFVGPLVAHKQSISFSAAVPTYAEIKKLKGKVLASGASMVGFCYIMNAAMYSELEAKAKDAGSGRFVIENGKIDGDPVFVTSLAAYEGKVAAGCFGYEALNQHGPLYFIVDPFTKAAKNVTVFTINADFSLTYLVRSGDTAPFAVGSK